MRLALIAAVFVTLLGALFASGSAGTAATFEGHWSMYERADATSFAAGSVPFAGPDALPGYEIVGMDAKGVTESLDAYQYWGVSHEPPMPEIVSCTATIVQPVMSLAVRGAYPFGGCVFFLGVTNAGESTLDVELGAPGNTLPVVCGGGPCQASDLDVLAGGETQAEIAERCSISGSGAGGVVPLGESLTYRISPGYTFVCPLFVVVLQPACENCEYSFEITPGPTATEETLLQTTPSPTATGTPEDSPTATPPPFTPTATNTPVPPTPTTPASPTATLTPVDDTAGVRTPGVSTPTRTVAAGAPTVAPTPLPPSSGNGVLVRRGRHEPNSIVPILLIAVATVLCLAIAWPSKRASYPLGEAAGGSNPQTPIRIPPALRNVIDRAMRRRR